ncbi:hypothetical protein A2153_00630 [Candidatus Gottesmanbacteria bacterium RBG_16_38_7b]|uniref:Uncharacterized protein n=1 Tax=Candidatus Gottesmanbacteria bacterium RBG_16_38_7b TaxID=1798372 RepID=A0A1F5YIH3_9BACT|nr:MAG: hypothetical protein A2153_00630 [Candidatus Gottesmanbacteria bacterium RBG_16_38_7b]
MIQAVIFDLDGFLIHSELPTFQLLQHIVKKYGLLLEDSLYKKRIGKRIKPFLDEVCNDLIPEEKKRAIVA